jgi:uncharacterized protein YceK
MAGMIRALLALTTLAAIAGCGTVIEKSDAAGGIDGQGAIDGAAVDASLDDAVATDGRPEIDARVVNELGRICTVGGTGCSAGNTCIAIQGVGSTTMGWCTPMCAGMNDVCTAGYTGPASGMPVCAVGDGSGTPIYCAIGCTVNADCPTGMTCIVVPNGGGGSICAVP